MNIICCLFMSRGRIYKRAKRELNSVDLQIRNHWYQHLFKTGSSHKYYYAFTFYLAVCLYFNIILGISTYEEQSS